MSRQSAAGKQAWARRTSSYPAELRAQIERDAAATVAAWDEPATRLSIWERMAQSPPVQRLALTHDRIAEAALRIADTDGIAAVSMRRLATELGVSSMACYRYVSSKDDVIELMLDLVRTGMLLDDPAGDWQAVLRASAISSAA